MYKFHCFCRYGYPDYTYLSRVRSELAAKGIGSTSASSAAVPSALSAKTTTTSPTLVTTAVAVRMPAYSSRERDATSVASAVGHVATYHKTRSCDFDRPSAPRDKGAHSYAAASLDSTSQYGIDTSTERERYLLSAPTISSSESDASYSSFGIVSSGTRPRHAMSTVDRAYHGSAAGTTYSSRHQAPAGGLSTRSSRRDDHDRLQISRAHPSSNLHSTISRTASFDRFRRCR